MRVDGGDMAVLAPDAAVVGEVARSGVVIQGSYLLSTIGTESASRPSAWSVCSFSDAPN